MKRLLQPGHLHANVDTQLVQSEALPFLSRPNHQRFFTVSKSSDMRDNPANSRPSCHLQCASREKLQGSHDRDGMKSNPNTESAPVAIHAPSLDGSEPQASYTETAFRSVTR
ncbi:hypothetical protein Bca4012_048545 [Brassica carinata]